MAEPTELMPCPFCGAAAHFEMDEERWEWVECGSCGMQGNRSASLMEDCKPTLAEAWNRRTPAPVGVEPIGYLYCGGSYGDELEDWEIVADQHQCDKLNEHQGALGEEAKLPIYTTPQPTQAQAVAVPLDEARRLFDAGWKAAALFCDREDVVADGIIGFGACPQFEAAFTAANGIKGGQHD